LSRSDIAQSNTAPRRRARGKQKMIASVKKRISEMAADGVHFKSRRGRGPGPARRVGDQLHVMLPLGQVMTAPGGELHLVPEMAARRVHDLQIELAGHVYSDLVRSFRRRSARMRAGVRRLRRDVRSLYAALQQK
jgi:hypothetical protein